MQVILLILFIALVLWYTVLKRNTALHYAQTELLWSYRLWFQGNWKLGLEILGNVAMFIPFGFLASSVLGRRRAVCVIISAFLLSLCIEVLQLVLMRGLFEWDDVINNTLGALIGWLAYKGIKGHGPESYTAVAIPVIGIICVLTCAVVFVVGHEEIEEEDDASRSFCFQVDELNIDKNNIELSGFNLVYGRNQNSITIVLKSRNTPDSISLKTQSMLDRPDVNEYFSCDTDYTHCGFTATGEIGNEEYEVMIKSPWVVPVPTGVFISSSGVHYVPENEFKGPEIDAEFVENGVLRVYRPDYHCWVYQYQNALYWIVDQDFYFEDDNTTYIQYQLWTTQEERLPEKRLEHGWDNIGGYFEKHEIEGDWNGYQVMKRNLPSAYSITSILTGYYKNSEWIWKEYFRPYYEF